MVPINLKVLEHLKRLACKVDEVQDERLASKQLHRMHAESSSDSEIGGLNARLAVAASAVDHPDASVASSETPDLTQTKIEAFEASTPPSIEPVAGGHRFLFRFAFTLDSDVICSRHPANVRAVYCRNSTVNPGYYMKQQEDDVKCGHDRAQVFL